MMAGGMTSSTGTYLCTTTRLRTRHNRVCSLPALYVDCAVCAHGHTHARVCVCCVYVYAHTCECGSVAVLVLLSITTLALVPVDFGDVSTVCCVRHEIVCCASHYDNVSHTQLVEFEMCLITVHIGMICASFIILRWRRPDLPRYESRTHAAFSTKL
jgi:hypothetical protein